MLNNLSGTSIENKTRKYGVVGAGGGGFPAYAKWARSDDIDYLMVNHQESEPNCAVDKWTMKNHSDKFVSLFHHLINNVLKKVVISAKQKDRKWLQPIIDKTDATVFHNNELPIDVEDTEGDIMVSLTEDTYEYGMESVLLQKTADTTVGRDLPMDYGWVVHNTETLYNIYQALHETPVTEKLLHIDGYLNGERLDNVMYRAPIGTSGKELFDNAEISLPNHKEYVVVDGGPGWGFNVTENPTVTKATNCLMLLDKETAEENTYQNGRVDTREVTQWSDKKETEPNKIDTKEVEIPLQTTDRIDIINNSRPEVSSNQTVREGQKIALPKEDGFSVSQHASIEGTVHKIEAEYIEIKNHN
jgi:Na+-translocating ferredoxin:NAD+ oxidoreductase RnfC subunit